MQGHPDQSVYNILKGAHANLTRRLAMRYGKDGIRVNGICPTSARTSMTRALFDDKDFDQTFTDSIPDESTHIHGDLIEVDGGETLCRQSV